MVSAAVHGRVAPALGALRDALGEAVETGAELGAAIAVDLDGTTVADLWGGWVDEARSKPWIRNTIVNLWSCTKTVTGLAALILADRQALDLDAPVCRYWPEFAVNGKDDIAVRHLLSHASGLSGWDAPFTLEDLYDWEKSTAALAVQTPWWPPGTASGYHALTQGHLVGEVVRRVSGRSLRHFVRDEIAGPLSADFQIGAADADASRIAPLFAPARVDLPPEVLTAGSIAFRTFTSPVVAVPSTGTAQWRAADIGAANGHGNARSLMRINSLVTLGGTVGGVGLLSPPTIERIFEVQSDGVDLVLGLPLRFGIGYGLASATSTPFLPTEKIGYWGGFGGSLVVMDPGRRITIAYVMNKLGPAILGSERAARYVRLIYEAIG